MRDPATGTLKTLANVEMPPKVQGLFRHIVDGGRVRQLDNIDESVLHIFSRDVLRLIKQDNPAWAAMVPAEIADVIRRRGFFGYHDADVQ